MGLMGKDKNISVSYYLDKRLKPKENEDGTLSYPVYIQVVYDGSNNKFKAKYPRTNETIYVREDLEGDMLKGLVTDDNFYYVNRANYIKEIIEFEIEQFGDRFTLKGIQKRIDDYDTPIIEIFKKHIELSIDEFLKDTVTYNEYINFKKEKVEVESLIRKLYLAFPQYLEKMQKSLGEDMFTYFIISGFAGYGISGYDWIVKKKSVELKEPLVEFFHAQSEVISEQLAVLGEIENLYETLDIDVKKVIRFLQRKKTISKGAQIVVDIVEQKIRSVFNINS